jgi:hypothetical protein
MIQRCGRIAVMSPDTAKHLAQLDSLRRLYQEVEEGGSNPMAGHRPFKKLIKGVSETRKARVVVSLSELKTEMHEPRQADDQSQENLTREPNAERSEQIQSCP